MDFLNELQYNFSTKGAMTGERQKDETGRYNPNLLDRILGVSGDDLRRSAQQGQLQRYNETAEGQKAAALGVTVTAADMGNKGALGLRVGDAETARTLRRQLNAMGGNAGDVKDPAALASMVNDQRKSNRRSDNAEDRNDLYSSPQQVEERRIRDQQFAAGRTDVANQMEMARLDNKFDRETNSANNALTLRLGQMNADLADKRMDYDRETRRMDKRSEAIAALMSGLGSLGGAFSL